MSYDRILFLPTDSGMSADKLAALVSKTFGADKKARILVEGNRVEVKWGKWSLRVYYEAGPMVSKESHETASRFAAKRPDWEQLARCDKWVTIASDTDYDMNHFNDFAFLLQDLEEALPGAVLFIPQDGTFFDAGDFN